MYACPRWFRFLFLAMTSALAAAPTFAQTASTTTLSASPTSPVVSGTMLTLTASVADTNGPVLKGSVTFYDGNLILGTSQMIANGSAGFRPGTAIFKTRSLSIATHSLTAKFTATTSAAASTSPAQTLTVTGPAYSIAALTSSAFPNGNYSLNATISGSADTTPTGNVVFTDTTTGTSLGTAALSPTAGQFVIGPPLPAGGILGDVNNDGISDVVTAAASGINVYLGNGDGTFQPPITTNVVVGPFQIADLNGDGNPDLIASSGNSTIVTLLGNGDGTFRSPQSVSVTPGYLYSYVVLTAVSDFDGDGILDLGVFTSVTCTCSPTEPNLTIYKGLGDGTFGDGYEIPIVNPFTYAAVAQGLVVMNGSLGLSVVSEDGLGTGPLGGQVLDPAPTGDPAIGDMNGDGNPDIVAFTFPPDGTGQLSIFTNDGQGGFAAPNAITVPYGPDDAPGITLVDFNRDGYMDVALSDAKQQLCVYLGNGDGTLSPLPECMANFNASVLTAAGNLRGFGLTDIVAALLDASTNSWSYFTVTSAAYSASASLTDVLLPGTGPQQVAASYLGDSTFTSSTSNNLALRTPLPVTIRASESANGIPLLQTVTFTVSVSNPAGITPAGTVQFYDGASTLGQPISLTNGSASYSTSFSSAGTHTIKVVYSGDANDQSCSSSWYLIVNKAVVTLSNLYTGPTTILSGVPITFPATMTANAMGLPPPTGTLYIQIGPTGVNSYIAGTVDLSGNPPFNVSFTINTASQPIQPDTQPIGVYYSGDANWAAANSSIKFTVQGQVSLGLSTNATSPVSSGTSFSVYGDLTHQSATFLSLDSGKLTLLDNGNPVPGVSPITIASAVASLGYSFQVNTATAPLSAGVHSFTVAYGGSAYWAQAVSNPVGINVQGLSATGALQFIPITPCRVADTRNATGPFGGPQLSAASTRTFNIPQSACDIPSNALAYSLNVTVVPNAGLGYLTIWPSGEEQPLVSTLNSYDGRVKANAAIIPAGTSGGVNIYASDATNVVLDIDGYFVPAGSSASALAFYPVAPCRVADTRNTTAPLGGPFLGAKSSRSFPVPSSSCNIPSTAKAYSLNVTAVPHKTLGYLSIWPTGQSQPLVSTLNAYTGTVTANAAIVEAGTSGEISVYASDDLDVILDVNGYFAPPETGGLSLYAVTPCRVIDTRQLVPPFPGTLTVSVEGSTCAPPSTAAAYVLNATVVPTGGFPYLSLWPAGQSQPLVSTLNAYDADITSNMAIVPTSNGDIDAYSSGTGNLILDLSSYFAP